MGKTEITTETPADTTETTKETPVGTTETILRIIGNNPKVTIREIASECGMTEDGAAYHIKKLKHAGRTIPVAKITKTDCPNHMTRTA